MPDSENIAVLEIRPEDSSDIQEVSAVRRVVAKQPKDDDLCSDCSQLDLGGVIQEAIRLGQIGPLGSSGLCRDIIVADVGYRYRMPRETNCPLCQMLEASRFSARQQPETDQCAKYDRDEGDEIRATSFVRRFLSEYGDLKEGALREENTLLCLIVVPRDFPYAIASGSLRLEEHMRNKGCAVLLQDGDTSYFPAPQVIPPLFDPRKAKRWIRHCSRYHGSLCNTTPIPVRDFRVIDCVGLSIEDGKLDVPYVALSYVWGALETPCDIVRKSDGTELLPDQLSQVIRDSIDVTKALGYRYLWIDKFCIDQNNPRVKQDQIEQMDAIYHNADLTVVAAAGVDETYGLPGVGMKARAPQLIAKSRDVSVIWTMSDPQQSISSSHWSSRGWTFQEGFLSRRSLAFTDEQISFACNAAECFESMSSPLDVEGFKGYNHAWAATFSHIRGRPLFKHKKSSSAFVGYLFSVEAYSSRKLRYDYDALNAFQGVVRKFSREDPSLNNFWGLSYPHNSKDGPRRRQNYPSWTWLGWEGEVQHEISSEMLPLIIGLGDRILTVGFENSIGDEIRFEDLEMSRSGHSGYTILRITTGVLPVEFISYEPTKNPERPWKLESKRAKLSLSSGESEAQLAQKLEDATKWRCIYIGHIYHSAFVMILSLDLETNIWVRAGMFLVDVSEFHWDIYLEVETFRIN
ncbi:hypothetical protein GQX73_g9801 [Xylaria multiplex]|uniref:Heterokaryon incompatibility domain-containing protein n=1 Tax=Xylaria multiplex TaxID=323545 RepID=A0A7C8IHH5_9PEZI|nr:hypothetical protein GQX73_g9801 [Xylaria multiplex]